MRAKTSSRAAFGNHFLDCPVSFWGDEGAIAMRTEYIAAIVMAVLAAGSGLAVNSVGSRPSEKQSTPAVVQLVDRLAGSVDPFLRSGG